MASFSKVAVAIVVHRDAQEWRRGSSDQLRTKILGRRSLVFPASRLGKRYFEQP